MGFRLYPKGRKEWTSAIVRLTVATLVIISIPLIAGFWFASMPGDSHSGPLPEASGIEVAVEKAARAHVNRLAGDIGERNVRNPEQLAAAVDYITHHFESLGFEVNEQPYDIEDVTVKNLEVILTGSELPDEILVVGAHYDTFWGTPGADDNASGVAGLLELARLLKERPLKRTVRLVALVNEEPPYFKNEDMGSLRYALACKKRGDNVVGMIALEMLGFYVDEPGLQGYPPPLDLVYPEVGNFIGFVSNFDSGPLVKKTIRYFRKSSSFPSEGLVGPTFINGVDFSDHWSFWQAGYPALMVTDTAFFRNKHYHQPTDTPDKLDYNRLARVIVGLAHTVEKLANE
jgi:hypothetical protein